MSLSPREFFDLTSFAHAALFAEEERVWEALDRLETYLELHEDWRLLGKVSPQAVVTGRVFLGPGAVVEPYAVVQGPCIIGAECEIRQGAYLRGQVIAGDGCVIGHCSEIKSSILLDGAKAPHFNYVGDSIMGNGVNLGAGTLCANLRLDESEIYVKHEGRRLATGRRKLGAIIGDGARTGCHTVLNPGTLLAQAAEVGPSRAVPNDVSRGACEAAGRTPCFSQVSASSEAALRGYSQP